VAKFGRWLFSPPLQCSSEFQDSSFPRTFKTGIARPFFWLFRPMFLIGVLLISGTPTSSFCEDKGLPFLSLICHGKMLSLVYLFLPFYAILLVDGPPPVRILLQWEPWSIPLHPGCALLPQCPRNIFTFRELHPRRKFKVSDFLHLLSPLNYCSHLPPPFPRKPSFKVHLLLGQVSTHPPLIAALRGPC